MILAERMHGAQDGGGGGEGVHSCSPVQQESPYPDLWWVIEFHT